MARIINPSNQSLTLPIITPHYDAMGHFAITASDGEILPENRENFMKRAVGRPGRCTYGGLRDTKTLTDRIMTAVEYLGGFIGGEEAQSIADVWSRIHVLTALGRGGVLPVIPDGGMGFNLITDGQFNGWPLEDVPPLGDYILLDPFNRTLIPARAKVILVDSREFDVSEEGIKQAMEGRPVHPWLSAASSLAELVGVLYHHKTFGPEFQANPRKIHAALIDPASFHLSEGDCAEAVKLTSNWWRNECRTSLIEDEKVDSATAGSENLPSGGAASLGFDMGALVLHPMLTRTRHSAADRGVVKPFLDWLSETVRDEGSLRTACAAAGIKLGMVDLAGSMNIKVRSVMEHVSDATKVLRLIEWAMENRAVNPDDLKKFFLNPSPLDQKNAAPTDQLTRIWRLACSGYERETGGVISDMLRRSRYSTRVSVDFRDAPTTKLWNFFVRLNQEGEIRLGIYTALSMRMGIDGPYYLSDRYARTELIKILDPVEPME